jgi:hypothetical protein
MFRRRRTQSAVAHWYGGSSKSISISIPIISQRQSPPSFCPAHSAKSRSDDGTQQRSVIINRLAQRLLLRRVVRSRPALFPRFAAIAYDG